MSHEFVHIDDVHNLTVEIGQERDTWKEIAEALFDALECEKGLRLAGNTDDTGCPNCASVIEKYWKAMKDAA